MIIMSLFNRAVFCCAGSLIDKIRQSIPVAYYTSPTLLESWVGGLESGSLELDVVPAFVPPFSAEDSSIQLEPSRMNEITWNLDIANPVFQKGDNINIIPNRVKSPTGSGNADVAVWFGGTGFSQYIILPLGLKPQQEYSFSAYLLSSTNSRFGGDDEILFVSDGTPLGEVIKLDALNEYPNRYRILETSFVTGGATPVIPEIDEASVISIVNVAAATLTISGLTGISENQLVGGLIRKNGETPYTIVSNTQSGGEAGEELSITIAESVFIDQGYANGDEVEISDPPPFPVELHIKVNNTASMAFGGLQLEEGVFRTSMIYQTAEKIGRSSTLVYFQPQDNPIGDRYSFTVFGDFPEWRGDGNLFDFGNLRCWVEDGIVKVRANTTEIQDSAEIGGTHLSLAISVSSEAGNISLYINGRLKAETSLTGYMGNTNAPFVLTSEGFRKISNVTVFGDSLSDGQVQVGEIAMGDIGELFRNDFIPSKDLSASTASLVLTSVRIPSSPEPDIKMEILAKTATTVTVVSGVLFVVNDPVVLVRGDTVITHAVVQSVADNVVTLDTTSGAVAGDYIVKGTLSGVSRVFVRFPWEAEVNQEILSVDEVNRTVTVSSALSYLQNNMSKAFVFLPSGQDVKEVLIYEKNNTTGVLTISDTQGIEPGMVIGQPKPYSETLIHPENYEANFLTPLQGVSIEQKALNGVVVASTLPAAAEVTPVITVAL